MFITQERVIMHESAAYRVTLGDPQAAASKSVKLLPEHADLIRLAVRKSCAYFGIKIRDLGRPSKWIVDAMRTGRPMSLYTAERLIALTQRPDPDLVGGKPTKGPSLAETSNMLLTLKPEGGDRPEFHTPAMEYISTTFFAGLHLTRYRNPLPGIAFFALPGTGDAIAQSLMALLPLPRMSSKSRRHLADALALYFKDAEQPMTTPLGERLIPRLVVLATIRSLNLATEIQKGTPEEDVLGLVDVVEAIAQSEERRERKTSPRKRSRKTRHVVMRKVRDAYHSEK
jgi:hypothetical protein